MKRTRCAIYTRKSSEDGLEQDFNSLDAQREACEAYIASQRQEGWVLMPDRFDDGGISGGHLDRPALHQLMAEVDAKQIDQIVVYKIDRLTRSLADFAKLVDRLDRAEASFVSVTQSFNTATSMGRLTLNVLLSFAQFEREVTAERIRDKIAASKRKGLWMGGNVPLGYEPDGRTLRINTEEAETVRRLYDLYDEWEAERSVLAIHHRVKEIAEAGVIPFTVGGDHSLMYSDVVAVTDVHGKGEIAVVHWDAHFDGIPLLLGHYLTHGGMVRRLIDEGHVKGEHFVQIGLNSGKPGRSDLEWMRANNMKFRFMHEVDRKGWRAVTEEILAELDEMGIEKVFLSLDTDVLEPAFAPGMGTAEPGGMSAIGRRTGSIGICYRPVAMQKSRSKTS